MKELKKLKKATAAPLPSTIVADIKQIFKYYINYRNGKSPPILSSETMANNTLICAFFFLQIKSLFSMFIHYVCVCVCTPTKVHV